MIEYTIFYSFEQLNWNKSILHHLK